MCILLKINDSTYYDVILDTKQMFEEEPKKFSLLIFMNDFPTTWTTTLVLTKHHPVIFPLKINRAGKVFT